MHKRSSGFQYSATDLINFLECRHLTELDHRAQTEQLVKSKPDEQAALIQAKGDKHEKIYRDKLIASGKSVLLVDFDKRHLEDGVAKTIAAMQSGADIIYQGCLRDGQFMGYSDFLRRVEKASSLGTWSYEVLDTKLARSPKSKFLIQLAFYSDLISLIQGVLPDYMYVILGNGVEEKFSVRQSFHFYQNLKERFLAYARNLPDSFPAPCSHCDLCHWRGLCEERRAKDDHLSLVANINKGQIEKLEVAGIKTLEALAGAPPDTKVKGIPDPIFERLHEQAGLQFKARHTGQRYFELAPPIVPKNDHDKAVGPRGFARLPKPDEGDLYFDMEGDPLVDGGLEYLFGVYWRDKGNAKFKAFWAHDRAQEKRAFEELMDFVTGHLQAHPNAYIYHYASYEKTALRTLSSEHGTREGQVDDLLRKGKLIDLYSVVREGMRVSENNYSLKSIEHFYLGARTGSVTNAGASIIFYEKYLEDPFVNAGVLRDIEDYNHEDVRSTYELHQWLLKIRPSSYPWANYEVSEEKSSSQKTLELEQRLREYERKLVDGLPKLREDRTADDQASELLYQLLDFHRRAAKPQWWRIFDRKSAPPEDRLNDTECIAQATLDPANPPKAELRSIRYTYIYPPQETKLKTGDSVRLVDAESGVSDLIVDEENRKLSFKIGKTREHPGAVVDIGLGQPVSDQKLRDAVCVYADAFIEQKQKGGTSRYPAIDQFLKRDLPKVNGLTAGEDLITPSNDPKLTLERITKTISALDHASVIIQGPPGTGKTYTGSRLIVSLLSQGKKIGISSNSHKAIINLLKAVDKCASEQGVTFRGVKKSNTGDDDARVEGVQIKDESSTLKIISDDYQLIAGTAWLFTEPDLNQRFDYLFVDEAGQVSLANLVGMGTSAKNIVLLGDQMQLSQPIQGKHPGKSGLSSLEYYLDGSATVSPERGIFLGMTWRMHSSICQFISEAVYDGRLKSAPTNELRRLVLSEGAHPALAAKGIRFIPIEHSNCSQSSPEEADLVLSIYQNLLTQSFVDEEGVTHKFTLKNILVVAPYNMHVSLLKRKLPEGAQVGTVDKFQGQEAEVVIFTMATSSDADLPRNIEFLFSKNRINVAISRARTLALVIANPALLSVDCNTPEQVQMVNTLCWIAKEYR